MNEQPTEAELPLVVISERWCYPEVQWVYRAPIRMRLVRGKISYSVVDDRDPDTVRLLNLPFREAWVMDEDRETLMHFKDGVRLL